MTYELAKKLKEAGFPQYEEQLIGGDELEFKDKKRIAEYWQNGLGYHLTYDSSCGEELDYLKRTPIEEWDGKGRRSIYFLKKYLTSKEGKWLTCYNPTLSELIEACGSKFGSLITNDTTGNVWTAYDWDGEYEIIGNTPEEAVANLYLTLKEGR